MMASLLTIQLPSICLSVRLSVRFSVCLFHNQLLQSRCWFCFDFIMYSVFNHSMSQHNYNVSYKEMQTCIYLSIVNINTLSSQLS